MKFYQSLLLVPLCWGIATETGLPQQAAREPEEHPQLIVHEWGTWTELQDLAGSSVGGINTDDEPVPAFVHRISSAVLESTVEPQRNALLLGKGLRRLEAVTTRLETPVVYFYPPTNASKPIHVSLGVQLRGGWLSEYFPKGQSYAPGLAALRLQRHAAGAIQWTNLEVGHLGDEAQAQMPETNEHVWLAPRATQAALVRASPPELDKSNPQAEKSANPMVVEKSKGEVEKYVFYRGVGSFAGPLKLVTDVGGDKLILHSRFYQAGAPKPLTVPKVWLVSVRQNGDLAFRPHAAFEVPHDRAARVAEMQRSFGEEQYAGENLQLLRGEMHQSLIESGLYADEATAMLETWREAYFASPGLRLFYLVPREWTDDRMPMTLSVRAELQRVMIGRIELFSDDHIETLVRLKQEPVGDGLWKGSFATIQLQTKDRTLRVNAAVNDEMKRFWSGENNLEELEQAGLKVPQSYKSYIQLGRFRNALLRHEAFQSGDPNLLKFLETYGLMTAKLLSKYPKSLQSISSVLSGQPSSQGLGKSSTLRPGD